MSIYKIPRLIRFAFTVVVLNVLAFSVFRLAFWAYFNSPTDPIDPATMANAFFIGFKFDTRLALIMMLPVLVLAWIPYGKIFSSDQKPDPKFSRRFWITYLVAVFALMLIVYITHFEIR